MRFHLPLLPFPPSPTCAYAGKTKRFARMMRDRGHTVIEHQPLLIDEGRLFDPGSAAWQAANHAAAAGILADMEPGDVVCLVAGRCQEQLQRALPGQPTLTVCEPFVGYGGVIEPGFRAFESYAWMHTVYGALGNGEAHNRDPHAINGRFYDVVIPNYYDPAEFPAGSGDGGYHLFIGRLEDRKGFQVAADACERLEVPLVVAGEGQPPSYGEYVGVVDHTRRAELMGAAAVVWVPTLYIEPFGGVAAEAQLCGTPVVSTDFGAFPETVEQGVSGFRCRTFGEFLDAGKLAPDLDRAAIRERALGLWTLDVVAPQFERWFGRLDELRRFHWGDPSRPVGV